MLINQFAAPPPEYGEVSFFWWHGDPIEKDKLRWILEQLKDKHICGLQINYCHSDKGGRQYGLTMDSQPPPFSDAWWELVGWLIAECRRYGIAVSLSDYTLGAPGQQSYMDAVLEKHPEFIGQRLILRDGAVAIERVPYSANPMAKGIGAAVADEFYGAFERHFPGECGKGVNYFFSDELNFNIRGNLWSDDFAQEFMQRKGYNICEKWEAVFTDIGAETAKIRLDYYDVIVELSEEAYFKPIYDWHQARGMTFGCDHGGRGRDVTEFGDYFRTMKWNQGPGNDQPRLASDIIKSKVSASIAHLYERPRVWLEGFYSSGWATSSADVADAVFRNFALGHNLLSLHGLYYSTHGSMWEWAPPCNHYHMPYWAEMETLLACTHRMSWLLAQGVHCCDVAIVYPVAAVEADAVQGKEAVETAFSTGEYLYKHGVDFDFIDFQSIDRAEIKEQQLCVAGEKYKAIVIPNMRAVRYAMLQKLAAFAQQGGTVVILRDAPCASDRAGSEDAQVQALVHEIQTRGYNFVLPQQVAELCISKFGRDVETVPNAFFQHRRIENKDCYFVYGAKCGTRCRFRAVGQPVLLNPWTGDAKRLQEYTVQDGFTELTAMIEDTQPFLLLFYPAGEDISHLPLYETKQAKVLRVEGEWDCELMPTMENRYGDYSLPAYEGCLGAQARRFRCCITEKPSVDAALPTADWAQTTYGYGPHFWLSASPKQNEVDLVQMEHPLDGFAPYCFSMKSGVEGDAGYQGSYHGLKAKISDDFIALGEKRITYAGSSSVYESAQVHYLFTCVFAQQTETVHIRTGEWKPEAVWLNHKKVTADTAVLQQGNNFLLLKYAGGGRTHFVLDRQVEPAFTQKVPLAMTWYENPNVVPFDAYPNEAGKSCWYRFTAPPGMKRLKLYTHAKARVWADGVEMTRAEDWYILPQSSVRPAAVAVQLVQQRGFYQGAAMQEAVEFDCAPGKITIGQTMEELGLDFYAGGICYKKQFLLEKTDEKEAIVLEIGPLSCAMQVFVNGQHVINLVTPPYRADITAFIQAGENEIKIVAHNTLQNHMRTIPTNFNASNHGIDKKFSNFSD